MSNSTAENPKLAARLKHALLATLLAVLVLASIAAAVTAYFEASDIQDETLFSVATLVESNQIGTPTDDDLFDDDHVADSAVRVWELGTTGRHGIRIRKRLKEGFDTVREDDDFWRIYVTGRSRGGKQYVVAQKLSVSGELALNSAKNTALPLLLLFLLVPLLVTLIVNHSFKPLNALTTRISSSDSLQLDAAKRNEIPVEIVPFVSAIDSLLEKNEAYNQQQRRFIADAAHELRTPIAALSLNIDNLQAAKSDAIRDERHTVLAASVVRLQRLINQLLDLARLQSKLGGVSSAVILNDVVKTQIADLYPLAESKNVELSVSRNVTARLRDNDHQLQHLVRNALSNAIKFTPACGSVEIAVYLQEDEGVFCVSDTGPGVTSAQLENLHQPFYRPDDQASGHGAGLGLAICYEIAAHLGGQLELMNVHPSGFRFCYRQKLDKNPKDS